MSKRFCGRPVCVWRVFAGALCCCDSETKLSMGKMDGPRPPRLRRRTRPRTALAEFSLWRKPRPETPAWASRAGSESATRRVSPPALGRGSTHKHTEKRQARGPVLLRPPRRRPEHRAPKLIPRNARVAIRIQRLYSGKHVVHVADT